MNLKKELTPEQKEMQRKSQKKYLAQFADFKIRITPQERDTIQAHAKTMGESSSAFVKRSIWETMERDKGKNTD